MEIKTSVWEQADSMIVRTGQCVKQQAMVMNLITKSKANSSIYEDFTPV